MSEPAPQIFAPASFRPAPSGALTISQVVREYFDHGEKIGSRAAQETRHKHLADLCDSIGHRLVTDVRAKDLLYWMDSHPSWRSGNTRNRVATTCKTPFNWAARHGIIDRNPFSGIEHEEADTGRAMTLEEYKALLRASDPVFARVLRFLRWTACRPGELAALEWAFLDPRGYFTLIDHKTRRKRKDRKPRTIILPDEALRIIERIRRHSPDPRWVFVNRRGKPWTRYSLDTRIKRLRKRLGLAADMKLYGLRHARACELILLGVDIKAVATLLGHTSTRVTEAVYVKIDGEIDYLKRAANRKITD